MSKGSEGCQTCSLNCELYSKRVGDFNRKLKIQRDDIEILQSRAAVWKANYKREYERRVNLMERVRYLESQLFNPPPKVD